MKQANEARLQKALSKEYRFDNGRVMSLQSYIETNDPTHKTHTDREYATKKRNGEYKKLDQPRREYTIWFDDTGIQVPKMVYDYYDLPNEKPEEGELPRITEKQAKAYLMKLETDRPVFFWDQLMPALESYGNTGMTPINPPIVGAMVETGTFDNPDRARALWEYWNS